MDNNNNSNNNPRKRRIAATVAEELTRKELENYNDTGNQSQGSANEFGTGRGQFEEGSTRREGVRVEEEVNGEEEEEDEDEDDEEYRVEEDPETIRLAELANRREQQNASSSEQQAKRQRILAKRQERAKLMERKVGKLLEQLEQDAPESLRSGKVRDLLARLNHQRPLPDPYPEPLFQSVWGGRKTPLKIEKNIADAVNGKQKQDEAVEDHIYNAASNGKNLNSSSSSSSSSASSSSHSSLTASKQAYLDAARQALSIAGKMEVSENVRYAGSIVNVTRVLDKSSGDAKKAIKESEAENKQTELEKFANALSSKRTVTSVDKSSLDWQKYKEEQNFNEELQNAGKDGWMERQSFLGRVDERQFEQEKEIRERERARRAAKAAAAERQKKQ